MFVTNLKRLIIGVKRKERETRARVIYGSIDTRNVERGSKIGEKAGL